MLTLKEFGTGVPTATALVPNSLGFYRVERVLSGLVSCKTVQGFEGYIWRLHGFGWFRGFYRVYTRDHNEGFIIIV